MINLEKSIQRKKHRNKMFRNWIIEQVIIIIFYFAFFLMFTIFCYLLFF